ncbi:alkaline shock response membrane anchor protein AmaP [Streptomyces cellostaticus]|uniref:alkaline shock response membrane anchor protein AmaP n=1 Tax=Streptomyces cellostaticus TaxID=67285 RepID=UPI0020260171|nr:alkaline shock response membrane anchor protein AmaP [Streptomyces cellostaticus]
MRRTRTVVNRSLLGVTGLVLVPMGVWLSVTGTSLARRLPSGWPVPSGGRLPAPDRLDRLRGEDWWPPSLLGAVAVLTAVFTWWFLAQFRSGPARSLPLAAPGGTVRSGALAEALALRAAAVPGVARGRARVVPRSRRRLEVRLRVWLGPGTRPADVLPALCAVTAEAERSAAPYTAHTRLRVSAIRHRTPHVR